MTSITILDSKMKILPSQITKTRKELEAVRARREDLSKKALEIIKSVSPFLKGQTLTAVYKEIATNASLSAIYKAEALPQKTDTEIRCVRAYNEIQGIDKEISNLTEREHELEQIIN